MIHWAVARDTETGRKHLSVSCAGKCNGNVLYQRSDVPAKSIVTGSRVSYGSRIWVDRGSATGTLQLFMFDATGKVIGTATKNVVATTNKEQSHWAEAVVDPRTTSMIWAFYPATNDTIYHVTNPWLVIR